MANSGWTQVVANGYIVATETCTLRRDKTEHYSSEISFIPEGKDFVVISNSAAVTLSVSMHTEVYASEASAGTFRNIYGTAVVGRDSIVQFFQGASFEAANLNAATKVCSYQGEKNGFYPYYKILLKGSDIQTPAEVITLKVVCLL